MQLLAFNQQLLAQAHALAAAHEAARWPDYGAGAGAHLRHIIEHAEALVLPAMAGVVDYDSRLRDPALQACPVLAQQRLLALHEHLDDWHAAMLERPVQVMGQAGTRGEFNFSVASTVGRELAFVASHTVHHFALLAAHCQQHGITTPAHFGKAPATVAHERAARSAAAAKDVAKPTAHQESSCSAPHAAQPLSCC